ncbi:hypothetical protein M5X11_33160 [Paenibacillus alginolyticus]|uniref:hypothetical protein n=1 Tax=Paenibacillus alginolyticus TaxID=59839 RepID=UPI0003F83569|nr:hypothetical protein [Paenibacillus alginolyticus]MCY9669708.1 hypothetical protein [Paenibacillus alginolyticus]
MWTVIASIVAIVFLILLELPALRKGKQYKEMTVFGFLLTVSLTIFIMQTLHIRVPNPLELISAIYERLGLVTG